MIVGDDWVMIGGGVGVGCGECGYWCYLVARVDTGHFYQSGRNAIQQDRDATSAIKERQKYPKSTKKVLVDRKSIERSAYIFEIEKSHVFVLGCSLLSLERRCFLLTISKSHFTGLSIGKSLPVLNRIFFNS